MLMFCYYFGVLGFVCGRGGRGHFLLNLSLGLMLQLHITCIIIFAAPPIGFRPECYTEQDGVDYKGFISTTVSGNTCDYWRDRTKNKKYQ